MDGLTSIYRFEGVIKKAIQSLKYKYATEIVRELCGYYVPEIKNSAVFSTSQSCLLPIPIHWYRQNNRGFNQSVEVGRVVANEMKWKFEPELLIRNKSSIPQAGLSVKERKKNLRGAFSVSPNILVSQYPSILLFDDVFTTGSTLHEACKVLKRNGVTKVWGMTIAR